VAVATKKNLVWKNPNEVFYDINGYGYQFKPGHFFVGAGFTPAL